MIDTEAHLRVADAALTRALRDVPHDAPRQLKKNLTNASSEVREAIKRFEFGFITCPRCHLTSYNQNDVENRYCGNCHMYHDQMGSGLKAK